MSHDEWHAMVEALYAACVANDVPPSDALGAFFRQAIEDDAGYHLEHATRTAVPQPSFLRPSNATPPTRRFT